jgi:PAS domain-containing protein
MRASGAERITGQRDRRTAPGIRGQAPAGDTSFAVLSELIPVGIVRSDADGFIQFANDTWSQLTGIPASEVIGKN